MNKDITLIKSPEERELDRKRAELAQLEAALVQKELQLATLLGELRAFEARYLQVVGKRLARLDELEALIAEALANEAPKDFEVQERANRARAKAQASRQAANFDWEALEKRKQFKPKASLKRVYRDLAKQIHPDLADDEKERAHRDELMKKANKAFQDGDEETLLSILDDWERSPDSVVGEGISFDLVRAIRKIDQINKRINTIEKEIAQLKDSDLFRLKEKIDAVEATESALLSEMATELDKKMSAKSVRLEEIIGR